MDEQGQYRQQRLRTEQVDLPETAARCSRYSQQVQSAGTVSRYSQHIGRTDILPSLELSLPLL